MTNTLHAQTARANGAKSRGPVTAEGKARSAENARKHGLNARTFKLDSEEDQRAFAELEAELIETYIAVTPVQKRQATEMAIAMWRQRIVANMEMALISAIEQGEATANEGGAGLPSMNSVLRYRARIERDLKSARESLLQLQAARVKMFAHKMKKAKEFKELNVLGALRDELGDEGFTLFVKDCMNEPKPAPAAALQACDEPAMNREQRRRLEAMARKNNKKR